MTATAQGNGHDAFAATFRHNGEFRCVWLFDAPKFADAEDAVVLDDGSVVVVGRFEDGMDIRGGDGEVQGRMTPVSDGYDGFVARFAPAKGP